MFASLSPLLLVGLSFVPNQGEKEDYYLPYLLLRFNKDAKILDVLENNDMVFSVGKPDGARKGMEMYVYRPGSKPLFVRKIEFVEVGAKFSIARFRDKVGQPQNAREGDLLWFPPIWNLPVLPPPLSATPDLPTWQQPASYPRGGAIVGPEGILKRKEKE